VRGGGAAAAPLDEIDDRAAAGVEQRVGAGFAHPGRPLGGAAPDRVVDEIAGEVEEGGADQPLQGAEAGAEDAVDGPDHRIPDAAADPPRDELADSEDDAEDQHEGEHRRAGAGADRRLERGGGGAVEELEEDDRDDPGGEAQHLADEALEPAEDEAAADEEEDDDVERGHGSGC
jgi:hypothetical protein